MTRPSLRLWFVWLVGFYVVWVSLVVHGNHLHSLVTHRGIALAMAIGSYVAGSTPMGGGSVGFPVLVLLFDQPAALGRDFSFAVQSVGMTSASIFILCRRQPLEWRLLGGALLGAAVGTPLGILLLAPHVSGVAIKLVFAIVWASFGVLHIYRLREFVEFSGLAPASHRFDRNVGLIAGFGAGLTVASITGVGIDMVVYGVLVLLCRADLKIAIPTSVVVMAFTSVVGIATKMLMGSVQPQTFEHWLAAAPIVALGAPLGALIVDKIGRTPTLLFVSLLCIAQLFWTLQVEWTTLGWVGASWCLLAVAACNVGFEYAYRLGSTLVRTRGKRLGIAARPAV